MRPLLDDALAARLASARITPLIECVEPAPDEVVFVFGRYPEGDST